MYILLFIVLLCVWVIYLSGYVLCVWRDLVYLMSWRFMFALVNFYLINDSLGEGFVKGDLENMLSYLKRGELGWKKVDYYYENEVGF